MKTDLKLFGYQEMYKKGMKIFLFLPIEKYFDHGVPGHFGSEVCVS